MKIQEVLKTTDFEVRKVPCAWGEVYLRTMSGSAKERLEARFQGVDEDPAKLEGFRGWVVGLSWCDDETGEQGYVTDDELDALGDKSGLVLDELFEVCDQLSKLRASHVDEAVKN